MVSSYASNGFEILSDQLERTVHLLKVEADITALAEDDQTVPQSLIIEVFAIREEIEDVEIEGDLDPILMET